MYNTCFYLLNAYMCITSHPMWARARLVHSIHQQANPCINIQMMIRKIGVQLQLSHKENNVQPIMLGDAKLASEMAARMLDEGIYVIGFSYPVVPKGTARIRVQLSASHSANDIDKAVSAFKKVGERMEVISKM
jgi:7-keto-8-aminopelargonate synthetase-like enzyme